MTSSAPTPAQIQSFELAHRKKIYIIRELLGCMKGRVLLTQSRRASVTQGSNRKTQRREDPILMASQKPETTHCNEYLEVKKRGPRSILWGSL